MIIIILYNTNTNINNNINKLGKGPLRAHFEEKLRALKLHYTCVQTVWLAAEDYPKLLGTGVFCVFSLIHGTHWERLSHTCTHTRTYTHTYTNRLRRFGYFTAHIIFGFRFTNEGG